MKKDGLDPDRVRRQGRLAGDGHLRHPQHAHQRLRLPRQPDGRQGVVGRTPKVKTVFDTWAELLPYHQPGSLGRTWQEAAQALVAEEGRHVPARARSSAQQFTGGRPRRPRLLRLPGGRLRARHGLDRRPDRRLHDGGEAQERGRRQGPAGVPRLGRGARTSTSRPTPATSARTSRPTRPATTRCRRRRPRSSARPRTSPSSSTATPGRTSRRR